MSSILAIETSTLIASVALLQDDKIVFEKESGTNTHSEMLLPLVDECLAATGLSLQDLDTIAIGAGPGSFTGLRIGMATAKGLCFASSVSLTPVSSLAALAQSCLSDCQDGAPIAAVLDARRKEIFVGLFIREGDQLCSRGAERVLAPNQLRAFLNDTLSDELRDNLVLCGDGGTKYKEILRSCGAILTGSHQTPTAAAVARLARNLPASDTLASAKPTYIRLPEAQIKFPDGNTGGTFSVQGKKTRNS